MNTKTVKLSPEVIKAIQDSCISLNTLTMPSRQLPRKVYSDFKKAMLAIDGKWNRVAKAFTFPLGCDVEGLLAAAIETDEIINRKQTFQEFFTPPVLANRMAELLVAHLRDYVITSDTVRILEPSAGKGALVDAVLKTGVLWEWLITAVEVQPCNILAVNESPRVLRVGADFLTTDVPDCSTRLQDAVIMNPPFDHKTWVKHIEHAYRFMKKDGALISVVPATAKLEDLKRPACGDDVFITPVSFRFDGTNTKVAILTVGIPLATVHKFFPPLVAEKPLPKRVTVMSLDKCLAGLRKIVTAITHELDALEDMLDE